MQYFTKALIPSEVAEIYSEGPYISRRYKIFGDDDNGDNKQCDNDNDENY